mmetsp:Transcript_71645/g.221589  ORF Transcript_71645/g.221589 Transcript_71645/m.221589 type:complete len:233 (+) Transcript_71645:1177-1875(+)
MHHGIRPVDGLEAQVRAHRSKVAAEGREGPVCRQKAVLPVRIVLVIKVREPKDLLAAWVLPHVDRLHVGHHPRPLVLPVHQLPGGRLPVLGPGGRLDDAVEFGLQGLRELRRKVLGPVVGPGHGDVEAAHLWVWRVELLEFIPRNGREVAIEGLDEILALVLDPRQDLATLPIDVQLRRIGVGLQHLGERIDGLRVGYLDEFEVQLLPRILLGVRHSGAARGHMPPPLALEA